MVLNLFVQVLKKVLKSLKFELKNPAKTLYTHIGKYRPDGYSVHADSSHTMHVTEIERV